MNVHDGSSMSIVVPKVEHPNWKLQFWVRRRATFPYVDEEGNRYHHKIEIQSNNE